MKMCRLGFVTTLALSVGLTACSNDKPKAKNVNVIQIKGDPKVFFKNTTNNSRSTIREEAIDFNASYEISVNGFDSKVTKSFQEMVRDQEPDKSRQEVGTGNGATAAQTQAQQPAAGNSKSASSAGDGRYKFQRRSDGTIRLTSSKANDLAFSFTVKNGSLSLQKLITAAGDLDVITTPGIEMVHYSSLPDGSAHSILVYYHFQKMLSLFSYNIRKVDRSAIADRKTEAPYNYLGGRGVKVGWNQNAPLQLEMCSPRPNAIARLTEKTVKEWSEPLRGRLEIKLAANSTCPPFSDLTTHTIQVIEGWIEVPGADAMSPGATLNYYSVAEGKMIDSDMILPIAEWQEVLNARGAGYMKANSDEFIDGYLTDVRLSMPFTIRHEMGHMIGLHHQFDPNFPSIMAYMDRLGRSAYESIFGLQDYDKNAVQALYPEVENLSRAKRPDLWADVPELVSGPSPAVRGSGVGGSSQSRSGSSLDGSATAGSGSGSDDIDSLIRRWEKELEESRRRRGQN